MSGTDFIILDETIFHVNDIILVTKDCVSLKYPKPGYSVIDIKINYEQFKQISEQLCAMKDNAQWKSRYQELASHCSLGNYVSVVRRKH